MTAAEQFRSAVAKEYEQPDAAEQVVIDQVVRLLVEVEQLEQAVERDGVMVTGGNGQPVAHPALAAIRAHGESVARLCARLGIGTESPGTRNARRAANARWHK